MRRTSAGLLTLLAAAAALVFQAAGWPATAAPQAATFTDRTTVPIEFVATTCTGETLVINGESNVLFHATGTPSGHGVAKLHIQFRLSGETASGTRYVVSETVESVETRDADFMPSTFTSVGHLNAVSQGGTDNLLVRTVIHTTVNANGEITSTTFEFTVECRG